MKKKTIYVIGTVSILVMMMYLMVGPNIFYKPNQDNSILRHINPNDFLTQKQRLIVHLYFADKENSHLIAENRNLPYTDNVLKLGKEIILNIIKGPKADLMRTIPSGTRLNAFYIADNQTAYVDLSEKIKENHPGGVKTERLTIYSIVNSLILNIPEIKAVKILIGGREALTLAGHFDIRYPFNSNMLLVR